jgi:CheY-like chemotaxis protein
MREAVERAARLTKQLMAFGRRSVLVPHAIDVRDVVAGTLALLRKIIPASIDLELRGADAPLLASMDRTLVEQIVLNLVTNARDAIAGQGHIQVELERRQGPPEALVLRVVDDGQGMDDGVVKRVFEPFFTLKPLGRGTGLGLASVQGAVSQLGGTISVQSRIGSGSTFEIMLPLIAATPERAVNVQGPAPSRLEILVVDDDERVRSITALILRRAGHHVMEAADGHTALQLIRATPYDILISDVVMPRLGGTEVVDEARRLRPGMALVLASGYPHDGTRDAGNLTFLPKPYGASELLAHVARVVTHSSGASIRGTTLPSEGPAEP